MWKSLLALICLVSFFTEITVDPSTNFVRAQIVQEVGTLAIENPIEDPNVDPSIGYNDARFPIKKDSPNRTGSLVRFTPSSHATMPFLINNFRVNFTEAPIFQNPINTPEEPPFHRLNRPPII